MSGRRIERGLDSRADFRLFAHLVSFWDVGGNEGDSHFSFDDEFRHLQTGGDVVDTGSDGSVLVGRVISERAQFLDDDFRVAVAYTITDDGEASFFVHGDEEDGALGVVAGVHCFISAFENAHSSVISEITAEEHFTGFGSSGDGSSRGTGFLDNQFADFGRNDREVVSVLVGLAFVFGKAGFDVQEEIVEGFRSAFGGGERGSEVRLTGNGFGVV